MPCPQTYFDNLYLYINRLRNFNFFLVCKSNTQLSILSISKCKILHWMFFFLYFLFCDFFIYIRIQNVLFFKIFPDPYTFRVNTLISIDFELLKFIKSFDPFSFMIDWDRSVDLVLYVIIFLEYLLDYFSWLLIIFLLFFSIETLAETIVFFLFIFLNIYVVFENTFVFNNVDFIILVEQI